MAEPGSRLPGRALFLKVYIGGSLAIKPIRSNWLRRLERLPWGRQALPGVPPGGWFGKRRTIMQMPLRPAMAASGSPRQARPGLTTGRGEVIRQHARPEGGICSQHVAHPVKLERARTRACTYIVTQGRRGA